MKRLLGALLACVLLVGCTGTSSSLSTSFVPTAAAKQAAKVQHVIIIVQENRTPDNLFRGLPGADTVASVKLSPVNLDVPYDLGHTHRAFVRDFTDGYGPSSFGYVPRDQVQPYFDMAEQYTFADRMFQTNEGPSFPAHQYLVSGTSSTAPNSGLLAAENPAGGGYTGPVHQGGCDSPSGSLVKLIDRNGNENQSAYPCFDRPALTDLLDAKEVSWRYYQAFAGSGLWNGIDAIKHIRDSVEYSTNVVYPSNKVLTDIANGNLADVSWVTPTAAASDHANISNGTGPSWVASVVNAVGESKYWDSTVILITWDDWGGWYDHVKPQQYNSYELGFRVPLIVISPYAKRGYVSHRQYEFGSLLKFVERTFDTGSLGTTDARSNDIEDCFDWSQSPKVYLPIKAPKSASYFLSQPLSAESPDND